MSFLFLGDSHLHGFYETTQGELLTWQDNNYAEIYARTNKQKSYIYSIPGANNFKYPLWLKSMLDKHKDINTVFIHSTYWNRYSLSCVGDLDLDMELPIDCLLNSNLDSEEYITRYSDFSNTDFYAEVNLTPTGETFNDYYLNTFSPHKFAQSMGDDARKRNFASTKLWHELYSPIQFRNYCMMLSVINSIAEENNCKVYLYRLNDRVLFPEKFDLFTNLKNITIYRQPIKDYILENYNFDIEKNTLDKEHLNKQAHELIAEKFIPHLTKT